jgi:hypothetical protein
MMPEFRVGRQIPFGRSVPKFIRRDAEIPADLGRLQRLSLWALRSLGGFLARKGSALKKIASAIRLEAI